MAPQSKPAQQQQPAGLLRGRRGLILGIANERSIATAIARACAREGAELFLTFQNERLQKRVEGIATELAAKGTAGCDVTDDDATQAMAQKVSQCFGGQLDFVVHAVAFAEREDLEGRFIDTSWEGFTTALHASAYSLVRLCRALEAQLCAGESPSVLTLSYLGAQRVVPNYNVMGVAKAALEASVRYLANDLGPAGVRVNALSPGPLKTLSAAAIPGLRRMLSHVAENAPLRRNIDTTDVAGAALFALSPLASGISGETIYVDGGYHHIGAPDPTSIDPDA